MNNTHHKLLIGTSLLALLLATPIKIEVKDPYKGLNITIYHSNAWAGGDGGGDGGDGDGDGGGGDGGGDGDGGDGDGGGDGGSFGTTTCIGNQIRPITCLNHKGETLGANKHHLCDQNGSRPSTTRGGCSYSCQARNTNTNDGDGGRDPLIFDLDGNGVSLINADECVMFDIDNDGEVNQTGWVDPNDGLLAIDRNGNGIIDNQSELFGNDKVAAYADLAQYDLNKDGIINEDDKVWDNLKLWVDSNSNGQTDEGELKTLNEHKFEEISVQYQTADEIREGNRVTQTGTFTRIIEGVGKVVSEVIETFFDFFS